MTRFLDRLILALAISSVVGLLWNSAAPAAQPRTAASVDAGRPAQPSGTLTTTVEDPRHPNEPWVVTTIPRDDESIEAVVARHLAMVEAVRRALK